jgi:hypothetical protein
MPKKIEMELDQEWKGLTQYELDYLRRNDPRSPDGFFNRLEVRAILRNDTEKIVEGYLSLIEEKAYSETAPLKLVETLDRMRARDIAVQSMRFRAIGRHARREWPNRSIHQLSSIEPASHDPSIVRIARDASFSLWNPPNLPCPPGIEIESFSAPTSPLKPLDFSRVVILHMGFVKDDLVIALDANTEAFLYGREFAQGNRRINSNAFCEYSYQIDELSSERLICGPYRIHDVRTEIQRILEKMHGAFEVSKNYPQRGFFLDNLSKLYKLIDAEHILSSLRDWAESKNHTTRDICLVLAPDEATFVLPFGFLLDQSEQPLIKHLGGLSICLSLLALKWSLYRYHWRCEPFLSLSNPKCAFFGSKGSSSLDIASEGRNIAQSFGTKDTFIFSDSKESDSWATRQAFYCWHSSAEVLWFAGHGSFNPSLSLRYAGKIYPFPNAGIRLSDGSLTNIDLLNIDGWNFSTCWLVVLNSCLLGRTLVVSSNPLGFLSSLYSMGAISTVSSLWPIPDKEAIIFSEYFSAAILSKYKEAAFPRASALRDTLVQLWDELSKSGNPFTISGYFLCGIP